MTPRRMKSLTLLGGVLVSALTLLTWTQEWFRLSLSGTDTMVSAVSVPGSAAAPDLSALSLAGFALVAALAISGPRLRIAFGIIQVLIGLAVIASSLLALQSPVAASAAVVTRSTGVSGADSVAALVGSIDVSGWPWFAIVLGAVAALVGIIAVSTTRRWPGATRRYEPAGVEVGSPSTSPVSDWDELSGGSDPTSR